MGRNPWRERDKFCTPGAVSDVIKHASFGVNWLRGFGVARGRMLAFFIDLLCRHYNTLTRVCDWFKRSLYQWSFGKTGTTRTLASQAEIGVWVKAPEALLWGSEGKAPRKKWDYICKILQSSSFGPQNGSQCRLQCVLDTLTMETAFPRVPLRNDPCTVRHEQEIPF